MPKRQAEQHLVVLVTCETRRQATRIARAVVSERLAACVNILEAPVRSIYRWQGKVQQAREFLLLIKTSRKRLALLRSRVIRMHSYEVPEFIALPVSAGSQDYLDWLTQSLEPNEASA